MSSYDPEVALDHRIVTCADCPLDGLEDIIYERRQSDNVEVRVNASMARALMRAGLGTCAGFPTTSVSTSEGCGPSYRKQCSNPYAKEALGRLGLALAENKPDCCSAPSVEEV